MVVSQNKRAPDLDTNILQFLLWDPKMVPLILGNSNLELRLSDRFHHRFQAAMLLNGPKPYEH